MENKERLYWNVVKGIAVFLMLWGHCIQYCGLGVIDFFCDPVFKFIYSFHMPLFMLVSGYLFYYSFQKRNLKSLLVHRIQGMIHPIVFCTVLSNLLMQIPNLILSNRMTLFFGDLFTGIEYSLWFLWSVLISCIPVAIACKITKNTLMQLVLLLSGILFIALFPQWDTTIFMYPYFVVGFLWALHKSAASVVLDKIKYISLVVFPVMLYFYETKHYIYVTSVYSGTLDMMECLNINFFRWIIGFAGSFCILKLLEWVIQAKRFAKLLIPISKIGENSLQIYCLSVPLLSGYLPHVYRKMMEPFGCNLFAENMLIYDFILTPLISIVYAALLYYLVLLLRRVKLHSLIFGR